MRFQGFPTSGVAAKGSACKPRIPSKSFQACACRTCPEGNNTSLRGNATSLRGGKDPRSRGLHRKIGLQITGTEEN